MNPYFNQTPNSHKRKKYIDLPTDNKQFTIPTVYPWDLQFLPDETYSSSNYPNLQFLNSPPPQYKQLKYKTPQAEPLNRLLPEERKMIKKIKRKLTPVNLPKVRQRSIPNIIRNSSKSTELTKLEQDLKMKVDERKEKHLHDNLVRMKSKDVKKKIEHDNEMSNRKKDNYKIIFYGDTILSEEATKKLKLRLIKTHSYGEGYISDNITKTMIEVQGRKRNVCKTIELMKEYGCKVEWEGKIDGSIKGKKFVVQRVSSEYIINKLSEYGLM